MSVDSDNKWHLDKRVQVPHIVATAVTVISAVLYLGDIKKDVELLKVQQHSNLQAQRDRDDRQDKSSADSITLLRTQLERMESKIDRIVERAPRQIP